MVDLVPLSIAALTTLRDSGIGRPSYDRAALVPRIVHIGVGGFHRSHLALYCHLLAEQGEDWGICGVGLLESDCAMAEALSAQDHLYTLTTRHDGDAHTDVIGSIIDYVLAPDGTDAVAERIGRETTAIVSMTVTEAGYTDTPRNRRTFDTIAAGLALRRDAGLGGLTVLSCDNMTGNGEAARRCVTTAALRHSTGLAEWVERSCTFPNSMVDRITPATADADRTYIVDTYGLVDRWPVVAEPFRQWVLEDSFAAGRPHVERVGALLTADVRPWELYKLRILNAGHSSIAHLASLAGVVHVDEAVADPDLGPFLVDLLMAESVPTLSAIDGHPPEEYLSEVLDRFSNTGIRDRVSRLCTDATAKVSTYLVPILSDLLDLGRPVDHLAHVLAGWAHYLAAVPVRDQAPDASQATVRPLALASLDDPTVFLDTRCGLPTRVIDDARFRAAFTTAHRSIARSGPRAAVRALRAEVDTT